MTVKNADTADIATPRRFSNCGLFVDSHNGIDDGIPDFFFFFFIIIVVVIIIFIVLFHRRIHH